MGVRLEGGAVRARVRLEPSGGRTYKGAGADAGAAWRFARLPEDRAGGTSPSLLRVSLPARVPGELDFV